MVRTDPGMHSTTIPAPQQVNQRTIPTLERQVEEAIGTKPLTIDLDLSAVQTLDSAALNWLLALQLRLDGMGIRLRLCELPALVSDIFMATRLDGRFSLVINGVASEPGGGKNGGH